MRYAFFFTIFLLLQLFSLGTVLSIQWWLQPWMTPTLQTTIWVSVFIITNGLLVLSVKRAFANSYRWISGWMLIMHFMILTALAVSLFYGGYLLVVALSGSTLHQSNEMAIGLRVLALFLFLGLFIYSLYSAYTPVIRKLSINIDKPLTKPLRIAVASDLHIGRLFGVKAIDRLQQLMIRSGADMLLMPGDIMDDNTEAFNEYHMEQNLAELCSSLPRGVYATLGNHDLYAHERPISEALQNAGIQLLNDEVLYIEHEGQPVWLVGRFDNHKRQRVATTDLLTQVDTSQPVILLDHRPSDIDNHSQLSIDLQVSGHTHNGQVFPANFIVNAINRLGYGYEQIGKGHFVVSSGYGFWGIPFRLGSRSEIWLITLSGNTN
ncbi:MULTISPECIES: metallophosphoesterase [unclassified Psychrobacter]|uniref:metallophosphoesterase n=1 Tax=unclassified Psychrobacter TaxID=196806 RepID=UPI00086F252C|nr:MULTISPECIES: metallophosphoesterase [unclassified Psychrobacter]OEH67736.1 MAG: metallophosphoesterase [Psychrobacter sp. B29-1]PKG64349.1 metallophosphoesterase [Psychrobacter sp. Choline-02u-13]PKH53350.1 metallophosphoesterase [Psychrobacter sp. Choline-02u-9]